MNPQLHNIAQGYKVLGRDPGPWVTQRNEERNAQLMQRVSNDPRFQLAMQRVQSPVSPEPILSKDSPQLQGAAGRQTEAELDMEAVKAVANNPRFQQFMQNPILSKDSPRLQGLPDNAPQKDQEVSYMDPLYGEIALVGMGAVGNFLDKRNERRAQRERRVRNLPDWFGKPVTGSEGDYVVNSGVFRPKDYVATQFRAYPRGSQLMAEGGVVDEGVVSEAASGELRAMSDGVIDVPGYFDEEVQMVSPPVSTAVPDGGGGGKPVVKKEASKRDGDWMPTPKTDVFVSKNTQKAFDYYVKKGIPVHIAAGIAGNTNRESGSDPRRLQNDGGPGTGIAQWGDNDKNKNSGGRWNQFLIWAKNKRRNPYRLETQLDYILEEPGWGPETLAKLHETDTPERASLVFGRLYEKPSEKHAAWDERAGAARKLYDDYMRRQNNYKYRQLLKPDADINLTMRMGLGDMDMASADYGNSNAGGGGAEEEDQNTSMAFSDMGLLPMVGMEGEEGMGIYERGGEYLVTPTQLKFILANGGEVEFL